MPPTSVVRLDGVGYYVFTEIHKAVHLAFGKFLITIILNSLKRIATATRSVSYIGHKILILARLTFVEGNKEQKSPLITAIVNLVNLGEVEKTVFIFIQAVVMY